MWITSVAANRYESAPSICSTINGSESYQYDSLGRITRVTKTIDSTQYVIQYAYNLAGELTSITYPSGRGVQQSYDSIGRLSQIASGGANYLYNVGYNAAHQPEGFAYGNEVTGTFTYNVRRQLASLQYKKGTTDYLKLTYDYGSGNNGQIQSITDNVDPSRSMTYTYDAWARLKEATAGPTGSPTWKLDWDYDRYGNRKNQNVRAGTAPGPQLGISETTNRINDPGYSYDAAGNMTNDALNTYTYDAENRVKTVNVSSATYHYDGAGLRVKKVVGPTTTRYVFSGTKVIAEYVNGSLNKEYIYSGSKLLATIEGSTTTYHHQDHLSVRINTNASGTVAGQQGHYPFGESWYA